MTIKVEIIEPEKCAICRKALRPRKGSAIVFYFAMGRIAGAWHSHCGPLPYIEGLTAKARA